MEHSDIEHMAQGYPPAHIDKDCEEVITWLATQLLATQEQRDALAAENAALRNAHPQPFGPIMMQALDAYEKDREQEPETGMLNAFFILRDSINIPTPASTAYLNSVRAEGLKMAIDHMNNQTSYDCADVTVLPVIEMYNQIRAGEPS